MGDKWQAAIVPDEVLERPLAELSAAEFLKVLQHPFVPGERICEREPRHG